MKKTITLLIVISLIFAKQQVSAQQSVAEAIKAAEKVNKKVNKKWFKKFAASYPQALNDIAKIETEASKSEFGYDKVVDHINKWIRLNNIIKKFNGELAYKGETVKIEYKDYNPLKEEAREKAPAAHFNAAMKIIEASKDYEKRKEALNHLSKCWKYDYKKEYKDKINELKAQIYYEEGLRILNNSKTFAEKEKCKSFFDKATTAVKDYKDTKNLIAQLYFDEAVKLSKSTELKDLYAASNYFLKANKAFSNYKNAQKLNEELKNKIAEKLYQDAIKTSKEKTFEAQLTAAKGFKNTQKWVKDYKDAAQRQKEAEIRSKAYVLIVDINGNLVKPSYFSYELEEKAGKYIETPNVQIEGINLNNPVNYAKVKQKLGYGFILIKKAKDGEKYKFESVEPISTTENITAYFCYDKDKKTEKLLDKSSYKSLKFTNDLIKNEEDKPYKFYTKEGKLTTTKQSSKFIVTYNIEIWDVRNPKVPVKLASHVYTQRFKDSKTQQKYTGDPKAKPNQLINDQVPIKTEEDFKKNLVQVPIKKIVKNDLDSFAKLLKNKVKYREY